MLPRKDYTPSSFNRTKPQWLSKYITCLYNQIQCTMLMHDIHDRNCPRHVWISLWAQQNLWKLRISAFYTSVPHIHQPRSYTSSSSFFSQGIQVKLDISITHEKSMLISLVTSGELKNAHAQKNARYMKHEKLENIFTQKLLKKHFVLVRIKSYSINIY